MYALVDVNNMYASCERVFNPMLVGKPLVVLSSNDGACIARSNEAKELGIKMAQPWFQVRHLERSAGLIAVSANFELYSDMSARMMAIAGRYTPSCVPYSIDEAFLDFTGVPGDLVSIGHDLRATVLRELGLPTSVGFAATKTLAKLANHVAKTADRKPGSYPARCAQVCNFGDLRRADLDSIMATTDVGDVWGVGRKISEKLRAGGVKTVLDLVRHDTGSLRKQFGVVLEKTVQELRGIDCIGAADGDEAPAARQQILVSRSFGKAVTDVEAIVEAVSEFASRAAEKLRAQDSVAGAVNVFFMTSPWRGNDRQHSPNAVIPVRPTADSRHLVAAAASAARRMFRPDFNYAKAGVMLMALQSREESLQQGELDLFSQPQETDGSRERGKLMEAMDTLNKRFGRGAVRIGSASSKNANESGTAGWSVKSERRSPRYTTRWDEMPVATCR